MMANFSIRLPAHSAQKTWFARRAAEMRAFFQHTGQRWYLYLVLCVIWALAFVRVFIDPMPRLPVLFNVTPSLPYKIAVMRSRPASQTAFRRGDYVVYAFAGDALKIYPGLAKQPFFKIIRGIAGDRISVKNRHVYVNGEEVGIVKTHSLDRHPLEPVAETIIPPGYFYVQGASPDSFDSRYQSSGLVHADQIIGRVVPVF